MPPAPAIAATSSWDTARSGDESHTLLATATDRAGNVQTARTVAIVGNTPPTSRIVDAVVVGSSATFTFTGADNLVLRAADRPSGSQLPWVPNDLFDSLSGRYPGVPGPPFRR
jgi:hypothetical protein